MNTASYILPVKILCKAHATVILYLSITLKEAEGTTIKRSLLLIEWKGQL